MARDPLFEEIMRQMYDRQPTMDVVIVAVYRGKLNSMDCGLISEALVELPITRVFGDTDNKNDHIPCKGIMVMESPMTEDFMDVELPRLKEKYRAMLEEEKAKKDEASEEETGKDSCTKERLANILRMMGVDVVIVNESDDNRINNARNN
jgi:hypothetical protein